jgi:uncharacterized membrane protein
MIQEVSNMMIFTWLLIAVVIYYLIKRNEMPQSKNNYRYTPEDVLKERYAKGEIDERTFEKMKMMINE